MGSEGRRSAAYVAMRKMLQTGYYPCVLAYPGCTGRGTTVEHSPPLSSAPTPSQWRGSYLAACPACQSRQGNAIRQTINRTRWTW